jgi:hypothetical protein
MFSSTIRLVADNRLAVLSGLLSTGLLAHADVSGTWTGAKFTLELNAAGDKVSGVVTETGMEPRRFSDGSLDGSKVVFATIARLNGQDLALEWRGEVEGDTLTLKREFPSKPPRRPNPAFNGPFVLHRSR